MQQLPPNWYGEMMEHRGETTAHLIEIDRDIKEIKQSVKELHSSEFHVPTGGSNGLTRRQRYTRRVIEGGKTGGIITLVWGLLELARFYL